MNKWLKWPSGSPALRRVGPVLLVVFLFCASAEAQVTVLRPVDLLSMLQSGSAHRTSMPPASSDSLNPFDGNPNSDQLVTGSDTLVVTLQFDSRIHISATRLFCLSTGRWWLECANSLADLNAKSGSYALLVSDREFSYRKWDSVAFSDVEVQWVRFRARDTVYGSYIDLGEWTLMNHITFAGLAIVPYPARVIPGGTLGLHVGLQDSAGTFYPYTFPYPIEWTTDNASVAAVDGNGNITGVNPGETVVRAETSPPYLKGSAPVSVSASFVGDKVPPMRPRVALVLIDPPLHDYGDEPMHVKYHWRDPAVLSNDLVAHFRQASDSVVQFSIDTIINATRMFTRVRGTFPTVEQFEAWLDEPNWSTLKAMSDSGQIAFDYREMVQYYRLDSLRNVGSIDEVWVYAAPYMGMYESQLMGPHAFWWNSPPIKDGTALKKLLSVMGLNYERGVDQGFHSFGHRMESAMVQTYQEVQGRPWNDTSANPTPWDLFTRIQKDIPGGAHVGNIHFPPNGTHDYDYGNTTWVTSFAENWFRYPYLMNNSQQVNVSTWIYSPADPLAEGQDHLGYLTWWYNHIPRYTGVTDGVLNNWWMYFLDYDSAMVLAKQTPPVAVRLSPGTVAGEFELEQNFPNPFNPVTVVSSRLPVASNVKLVVYDVLGREVAVLINERRAAGSYQDTFDGSGLASGVYIYRLTAGSFVQSKKMLLLK